MVYNNPDASVSYCFPSVRRSFSSSSSVFSSSSSSVVLRVRIHPLPRSTLFHKSSFGADDRIHDIPTSLSRSLSLSLSFFLSIPRTTRNNNLVSRKEFQSFIKPRLSAMVLLHFLGSTYACACSLLPLVLFLRHDVSRLVHRLCIASLQQSLVHVANGKAKGVGRGATSRHAHAYLDLINPTFRR